MKTFFITINIIALCIISNHLVAIETGGTEIALGQSYITPVITNKTSINLALYGKGEINGKSKKIATIPAGISAVKLQPIYMRDYFLELWIINTEKNKAEIRVQQFSVTGKKTTYTILQPLHPTLGVNPPPTTKTTNTVGHDNLLEITINGSDSIESVNAKLTIKGGPKAAKPGKKG